MAALSTQELTQYRDEGFIGPYRHPLVEQGSDLGERAMSAFRRSEPKLAYPGRPVEEVLPRRLASGLLWFKSSHLILPELWEIAEHPAIRDRVVDILGPDVMWWGTAIVEKEPGAIHGWHYDTEYETHDDGVLVFLGLNNMTPRSALHVVTRTHHHRRPPVAYSGGVYGKGIEGSGILGDADAVLDVARQLDPASRLIKPEMFTGDFFIASGFTWHGSKNLSDLHRTAAVLHFAKPDAEIRVPISFDVNPKWYSELPPCAMLTGKPWAATKNPIVERPTST